MPSLEESILEIVKSSDGIKASEIANILHVNRATVNSILYSKLKKECKIDNKYYWHLNTLKKTAEKSNSEQKKSVDTKLQALCEYYLNCISLEGNNSIFTYLKSYTPQYVEIKSLDFTSSQDERAADFLCGSGTFYAGGH